MNNENIKPTSPETNFVSNDCTDNPDSQTERKEIDINIFLFKNVASDNNSTESQNLNEKEFLPYCESISNLIDDAPKHSDHTGDPNTSSNVPEAPSKEVNTNNILSLDDDISNETIDLSFLNNPEDDIESENSTKISYICDICRKQFSSKSSLSVHYGCHSQSKTYKCYICEETFVQAGDYADHYAQHCIEEDEEEYNCMHCDRIFSDKQQLDIHTQTHVLKLKENECSSCHQIFKNQKDLIDHQHVHKHSYSCLLCRKSFQLKSSLNRHVLIHNSEKPFQCKLCHKGYTQKVSLNKHMLQKHENIKPFHCKFCPKSFTSKASLELHHTNHTGIRPYTCLICDRSFTSRRNLKRHGMDHMPGQESTCHTCGKVFSTKVKLHFHSLVHTNDRPYKCQICYRGFTYSSHLKRHMLWHNNERPHVCDFCGKNFPAKFRLVNHLKKHEAELNFASLDFKSIIKDIEDSFVGDVDVSVNEGSFVNDMPVNNELIYEEEVDMIYENEMVENYDSAEII